MPYLAMFSSRSKTLFINIISKTTAPPTQITTAASETTESGTTTEQMSTVAPPTTNETTPEQTTTTPEQTTAPTAIQSTSESQTTAEPNITTIQTATTVLTPTVTSTEQFNQTQPQISTSGTTLGTTPLQIFLFSACLTQASLTLCAFFQQFEPNLFLFESLLIESNSLGVKVTIRIESLDS